MIGSPFLVGQKAALPEDESEARELYVHATKDKIGLLFLEVLRSRNRLEDCELESQYEQEKKKHDEQLTTITRVSKLFNSHNINYAIFKSIMPFLATLNDVDILHFGSNEEYKRAAEIMLNSDYQEIRGPADSSQRMFHDTRFCRHPDTPEKDVYDVDTYQDVAASYIIYLDKGKLEKYIKGMDVSGHKIKVLSPEADLMAMITHSIITEQLFTLLTYYATLHYLRKMNSEEIGRFTTVAKENYVTFPLKIHFSLVAELHKAAHGFVPEEITKAAGGLQRELPYKVCTTPHRHGWSTIIRTFLEKSSEKRFRGSMVKQAIAMLDPKLADWVIHNLIWRRRRETY